MNCKNVYELQECLTNVFVDSTLKWCSVLGLEGLSRSGGGCVCVGGGGGGGRGGVGGGGR